MLTQKRPAQKISLTILGTLQSGLRAVLVPSRIVHNDSDIFRYAISGDVCGMRALFRHGLAHPQDVNYASGTNALTVSPQSIYCSHSRDLGLR